MVGIKRSKNLPQIAFTSLPSSKSDRHLMRVSEFYRQFISADLGIFGYLSDITPWSPLRLTATGETFEIFGSSSQRSVTRRALIPGLVVPARRVGGMEAVVKCTWRYLRRPLAGTALSRNAKKGATGYPSQRITL